jgi:hypothetical protein
MSDIAAKTTYVFPRNEFKGFFYKVVTMVPKRLTIVYRESIQSGLDDQEVYVAAKDEPGDQMDIHDLWVEKAKAGLIPFDPFEVWE